MSGKSGRRRGKILLGLLITGVVLFVGGALAIRAVLTPDRLREETVRRASDATGLDVELERAGLSWIPFGVEVSGLRVAAPDEGAPPLLELASGLVRLDLRALLSREVVIERIELESPVVTLTGEPPREGSAGGDDSEGPPRATGPAPGVGGVAARAGLAVVQGLRGEIERLEVVDGTVRVRPAGEAPDFELRGVHLAAHVEATEGANEVRAEGKLELRQLEVPALAPYREALDAVRPGVAFAVTYRPAAAAVELRELRLETESLGEELVAVTGSISDLDDPAAVAFAVQARVALDLARLTKAQLVPDGTELSGRIDGEIAAEGLAARPAEARTSGEIRLQDLAVAAENIPVPVRGGQARAVLAGTDIELADVSVSAGNSHLQGSGRLEDALGPSPFLRFRGHSDRLDLTEWMPAPGEAAGASGLDAPGGGQGPTSAPPPLLPPIPPLDAELVLEADSLVTADAALADVSLTVSIEDGRAHVRGQVAQGRFGKGIDMTALDAEVDVEGQTMRGTFGSPVVEAHRVPLTDVRGRIDLAPDRRLRIDDVTATVWTGRVEGAALVDLTDMTSPAFTIETRAVDLQANDFLSQLTPARDFLFGTLDIRSTFSGHGLTPDVVAQSLTGAGEVSAREGRLNRGPQTGAIWNALHLGEREAIPFRDLVTAFSVEQGRLVTRDLVLAGGDAVWKASGSLGFDGGMDYGIEVELSDALSKRFRERVGGDLARLLSGSEGNIVVDLQVGGTTRQPKVTLDREKLAKRATQNVRDQLGKELDKNKDKLGGALKKLLGGK